jgi:hypothetical protein
MRKFKNQDDYLYRWRHVPRRLRKIYWIGPVVMLCAMLSVPLLLLPGFWLAEKFHLSSWIMPAIYGSVLSYFLYLAWKRRNQIEDEVVRNLPKGWHLIYRYHFFERRMRPEIVSNREFNSLFVKPRAWFRFTNVLLSRNDIEKGNRAKKFQ